MNDVELSFVREISKMDLAEKIGCSPRNITCLKSLQQLTAELDPEAWATIEVYIDQLISEREYETADVPYYITLWTIVVPIVFAIIIIVGILGNLLVIYVVLTTHKLKTSTYHFLVNLAVSDITVLTICVPFQAYKYAAYEWSLGDIWCKIIQYLLYVTIYVTIWTLVCIAGIRYVVLVHTTSRLNKYILKDRSIQICIGLWIFMLLLHIPTLLGHSVNTVENYTYCGIQRHYTKLMLVSFFVCAYVLPLCLICLFYLLVIHHLHINRTNCNSISLKTNYTFKVSKVVITVVLVFSACWLPFHVNTLLSSLGGYIPKGKAYEVFRVIGHCLLYGNSMANPFIYNFVSKDFRDAFKSTLTCQRCCKKRRPNKFRLSSQCRVASQRTELEIHD